MNTIHPGAIYTKMIKGEPLSDEEVAYGAKYFTELADQLWACGEVFKLSARELRMVGVKLTEYKKARAEHARSAARLVDVSI